MYGYLRWDRPKGRRDRLSITYKCYYCGLCNAMKKHYGLRSLLFLSNDITLILIAISRCTGKCTKVPKCSVWTEINKIDEEFLSEQWEHLAAISIGIAYAKALDDWLDERNVITGLRYILVKILSSKAYKKQIGLFNMLKESIHCIKEVEDSGADLEKQGIQTANMLINAIQYEGRIYLDEAHQIYVTSLAKWLCLIDAIDDYDKDKKYKKYNPFFGKGYEIVKYEHQNVTLKQIFLATYYCEIAHIYRNIMEEMGATLTNMKTGDNEQEILYTMTYEKMPNIFNSVLQRRTAR